MKEKIAIIGLGYVGLPLSIAFNKNFKVVGFDIDKNRIKQLTKLYDETNEVSKKELKDAKQILFTSDEKKLDDCDIFIVTVPTPIDHENKPDLNLIKKSGVMAQVQKVTHFFNGMG